MGGIREMGKEGRGPGFGGKGFAYTELEIWQDIRHIQKANGNTNLDDQTESMTSVGDDVTSAANSTAVSWLHSLLKEMQVFS